MFYCYDHCAEASDALSKVFQPIIDVTNKDTLSISTSQPSEPSNVVIDHCLQLFRIDSNNFRFITVQSVLPSIIFTIFAIFFDIFCQDSFPLVVNRIQYAFRTLLISFKGRAILFQDHQN